MVKTLSLAKKSRKPFHQDSALYLLLILGISFHSHDFFLFFSLGCLHWILFKSIHLVSRKIDLDSTSILWARVLILSLYAFGAGLLTPKTTLFWLLQIPIITHSAVQISKRRSFALALLCLAVSPGISGLLMGGSIGIALAPILILSAIGFSAKRLLQLSRNGLLASQKRGTTWTEEIKKAA